MCAKHAKMCDTCKKKLIDEKLKQCATIFTKLGIDSTSANDIFDAFDKVKSLPKDSYRIIICGSLYLAGEIIKVNN